MSLHGAEGDNNLREVTAALARVKAPPAGRPITGMPMAFLVTADKQLVAWDIAAGKAAWAVRADAASRAAVGATFVALREGNAIVAHDVASGRVAWSHALPAVGRFVGLAADATQAYYVVDDGGQPATRWHLVAVGAGGRERWRRSSEGQVGAPAARGGLVFMPFLTLWIGVLDAATGEQLARVRWKDGMVGWVRATPDGVFYGADWIVRFDERAVAGTKDGASFAAARLPAFVAGKLPYAPDGYNPTQVAYTALDHQRLLWRADASPAALRLRDNLTIAIAHRYVFAFDAQTGALAWAHQQQTFGDIVAAEDSGRAIVYVSAEGELGAIDRRTGAALGAVDTGLRVTGAELDVDGFLPSAQAQPEPTARVLATLALDRDARFNPWKAWAVDTLAAAQGADVTRALLRIVADDGAPKDAADRAAAALDTRRDDASVAVMIETLAAPGATARVLSVVTRALAMLRKPEAGPALLERLLDPSTPDGALGELAGALAAVGYRQGAPELGSFLLLHRADPAYADDANGLAEVIDALLKLGGPLERQLVAFVAADPRTSAAVARHAKAVAAE
jgi:outer membrane protein assembly factor BamB